MSGSRRDPLAPSPWRHVLDVCLALLVLGVLFLVAAVLAR